jgi:hypothetical protein
MSETWRSPRKKVEQEKARRRLGFEALMMLVDDGAMTLSEVFEIQRKLSPGEVESRPATVFQATEIARLERSIDSAEAGDD